MSRSINIKRLTSLLPTYLFYVIVPISLMGMMPGGGPPGDPYIQTYNTLTARYVATNQNTNQLLNNYNDQLRNSMIAMRDSAQDALLWAQHQFALAQIDFNTVEIIRRRIAIMFSHIGQHATDAQGREAAVLNNVPGVALLQGDQDILDAFEEARAIDERAQLSLNEAQIAVDEIQNNVINGNNGINNRLNIIQQRIMNLPILGINYTNADVLAYNQALTAIKNASNHINQRTFPATLSALTAHNSLNDIRQSMNDIVLLGNNLGIQLPPY